MFSKWLTLYIAINASLILLDLKAIKKMLEEAEDMPLLWLAKALFLSAALLFALPMWIVEKAGNIRYYFLSVYYYFKYFRTYNRLFRIRRKIKKGGGDA